LEDHVKRSWQGICDERRDAEQPENHLDQPPVVYGRTRSAVQSDLGQGPQKNIKNDYMLFCSNFNGTWDQYIDAFSDGIPNGLNLFWYSSIKYPLSIPITPFKNYITYNQIGNDYYYNATPGSAQRDIKSCIKVYDALLGLEKAHATQSPEEFQKTYTAALLNVQGDLGDPGFGPVASLDTERADVHRERFVREQQETFDSVRNAAP
jgi:hypothetical protein